MCETVHLSGGSSESESLSNITDSNTFLRRRVSEREDLSGGGCHKVSSLDSGDTAPAVSSMVATDICAVDYRRVYMGNFGYLPISNG